MFWRPNRGESPNPQRGEACAGLVPGARTATRGGVPGPHVYGPNSANVTLNRFKLSSTSVTVPRNPRSRPIHRKASNVAATLPDASNTTFAPQSSVSRSDDPPHAAPRDLVSEYVEVAGDRS